MKIELYEDMLKPGAIFEITVSQEDLVGVDLDGLALSAGADDTNFEGQWAFLVALINHIMATSANKEKL